MGHTRTAEPHPTSDVEELRLDPATRQRLEALLFAQIQRAWTLADLAGLRRAGWAMRANREEILRQRIRALGDGSLAALSNEDLAPRPDASQRTPTEAMELATAQCYTTGRIQLQVPGYMLRPTHPGPSPAR